MLEFPKKEKLILKQKDMSSKKISSQIRIHFKNILGRDLPEVGLKHFLELISSGKMSLQDVKDSISGSPEYISLKTRKFLKNVPKSHFLRKTQK